MILINALKKIFEILFIFSLIISIFVGLREKTPQDREKTGEKTKVEEIVWHRRVKILISISVIFVLLIGFIFIWTKYKELSWLFFVFGMPAYLEHVLGTYISLGILGNVINSKDSGKMSARELAAIETLAYAIWFLGIYNFGSKLSELAIGYPDDIISDIMIVVLYVSLLFIYTFFICALIPTPLFYSIMLLIRINEYLPGKKKVKLFGDFLVERIDKPIKRKSVLIWEFEYIREKSIYIRWIRYLLIPFAFLADIIVMFVLIVISMIISSLGYIVSLIRLFKKTVKRLIQWILTLSDKRIVAVSFRIALISAFACTVILNRYQAFLKRNEETTAVLEFIASSIIIPLIFEWINSARQQK